MSKEVKEKCKMCCYYNDKQQYPNVEGATTHSNCLSIKCQYHKITKDMQIRKLTHENEVLSKALELACGHISYVGKDTFIRRAEEEINNGNY